MRFSYELNVKRREVLILRKQDGKYTITEKDIFLDTKFDDLAKQRVAASIVAVLNAKSNS